MHARTWRARFGDLSLAGGLYTHFERNGTWLGWIFVVPLSSVLRAVVIAAVKPRFYRKVLIDTGIRPAWNWARGAVTAVQRDGILYVGGDQGPPEAHTGYLEEAQGPTIMALRLPGNGAEGASLRAGLLLLYCRANTAAAGTLVFEQEYLPATASAATPRRSGHDYRTRRG